jgi:hypothetical protein
MQNCKSVMTRRSRRPLTVALLALATLVVAGAAALAPGALAQSDPYSGGTPTPPAPGPALRLDLSVNSGPPGQRVEVKACCVPAGQQITVSFNGTTVISDAAAAGVGVALGRPSRPLLAVVGLARPAIHTAAAAGAGIDSFFVVPMVSPGPYDVCAATAGATPVCASFVVTGSGAVLGNQVTRGDDGGSALARTGFRILLFLLVAVGLLLLGRFLVKASQQRSSD